VTARHGNQLSRFSYLIDSRLQAQSEPLESTVLSAEYILETRGLSKEFKGFVAVNSVDLKVQRGHIHALIGPNNVF